MKLAAWNNSTVEILKDRGGSNRVKVKVVSGALFGQTLLVDRASLELMDTSETVSYVRKPPSALYHLAVSSVEFADGKAVVVPGKVTACGSTIGSAWETLDVPEGTLCLRCKRAYGIESD